MKELKKYYVCTPFWRSLEDNKKAFVVARTGSEAAAMVLGGKWKRNNRWGNLLENFATVYTLRSFDLIGNPGRIDLMRVGHYVRVAPEPSEGCPDCDIHRGETCPKCGARLPCSL